MSRVMRSAILRPFTATMFVAVTLLAAACATAAPAPRVITIVGLSSGASADSSDLDLGLNDYLAVRLKVEPPAPIDPSKYTLFLDGRPILGLTNVLFRADKTALIFQLSRNGANASAWTALFSHGWSPRDVSVALGEKTQGADTPPLTIAGSNGEQPTFKLVVFNGWRLVFAIAAFVIVIAAVIGGGKRTSMLRDSFLPQLESRRQTYSLGRCQMAFWFALIFGAFAFLYFFLWDYNTLTTQSLILMGISGATALFAAGIDATKDTPIGAINEKLRALGLNSYSDVQKLDSEIDKKNRKLKDLPPPTAAEATQLQAEIADRQRTLRAYEDMVGPFTSEGLFRDLTTDLNGAALHRLQVVFWTIALGGIFVIGVVQDLAMPQFSDTLLALMGVTSAGYVGFKYPERQS